MSHHVVAVALPGVVAFDLSTVAQVFGHADEVAYSFEVASHDGGPVPTSTGFSIAGASDLSALKRADTVVIPGYRPHDPPQDAVVAALRAAADAGTRMASVCTGAFALAATGLLDGLRCTTHWQDAEELALRYPALDVDPEVLYVDHGEIATSAGVAAGLDLSLHLVRRDLGSHEAARIARRMVVAPHRAGGQAQFIEPSRTPQPAEDPIGRTMSWALAHLDDPVSIPDLAAVAGWSPRHFTRRFTTGVGMTPLTWLTHQRVIEARRLLETTPLSLDAVARRTGLGTATNLRRHLVRELGITPSTYRATFGGAIHDLTTD